MGANDEYACHGNSWTKSCYRCTGTTSNPPGSPSNAPNCIRNGGTWALDADSTTESLCEEGKNGFFGKSWAFPKHFEGGDAVAGASVSDGGIMQVGQSCSTGPSHTLEADSCIKDTTFDADIDAGTTGSAAYAANLNYYNSNSGMNGMASMTTYPYVVKAATATASPNLAVDSSICFLPFMRPKNEGSLFMRPDATYGHVLITEPTNYATADKILFASGKASILGGTNAGDIEFATDKQVRLWGIVNSGSVKFTLSQDIVIGDVTNSGSIVTTGTKAAIVGVTNEAAGTVVVNGPGAYYVYNTVNEGAITINAGTNDTIECTIEDVTNEATGTVVVNGAGVYKVYNVVNKGAITINAGTVDALVKCNTGTITIGAGVTGTVTIVDGCTGGTITAGGATVVNAVAKYASFTISLDGLTAADFSTDKQKSFKEVVATAAGPVCGADGASSCAPSDVSVTVARRGVAVSYTIQTFSDTSASAAETTLNSYMASNQFVTDLQGRHVLKPRQHTRAPRAAIKQRIQLLPTTPNVLTTKRHTSLQTVAAAAEQLLLRTVAVKSSKQEFRRGDCFKDIMNSIRMNYS